jgi:hypothetical protein
MRPEAAAWISSPEYASSAFFGKTPATELAYEWLWDDLRHVSWVDGCSTGGFRERRMSSTTRRGHFPSADHRRFVPLGPRTPLKRTVISSRTSPPIATRTPNTRTDGGLGPRSTGQGRR